MSLSESQKFVLENCFGGKANEMLRAAEHFLEHGRPPTDLGKLYRRALGSRPRRPWWSRVREELGDLAQRKEPLMFDADSIAQLRAAWAAVRRGRSVVLSLDGKRFARVTPLHP